MKRRLWALMFTFVAVVMLLVSPLDICLAQSAASSSPSQTGVFIVKLFPPVYPGVPRLARITGEVDLTLGIGQDGTVKSAAVVSGPPLLQKVAIESAQKSQFECRRCSDAVTPYSLKYTFQLVGKDCGDGPSHAQVIQSENHIAVIDDAEGTCDPAGKIERVRSAKCLYLWKCGTR